MSRSIVLYGAGKCGKEALDWFGYDNIEVFIDNVIGKQNGEIYGKPAVSFLDYMICYDKNPDTDIVISIANKWVVHQISYELEKNGINDYSVFCDVKRRWKGPREFIGRDIYEYPNEHESVDQIRLAQNTWLLRHVDASKLTPALDGLREKQLRILSYTIEAFKEFDNQLGIKPIMEAGTLLGALRHKGFIPWDYDLDFCIPRHEYNLLKEYLEENYRNYVLTDKEPSSNAWDVIGQNRKRDFDVYQNYGEISLAIYDEDFLGFDTLNKNRIVDITPLDTFDKNVTIDDYKRTIEDFREIWSNGGDFRDMLQRFHNNHPELSRIPKKGDKLGRATDVAVGCGYVSNPGRWFDRQLYDYNDIYEPVMLEFENATFLAPINFDLVTKMMYGDNYMELPNRYGVHKENPELLFRELY